MAMRGLMLLIRLFNGLFVCCSMMFIFVFIDPKSAITMFAVMETYGKLYDCKRLPHPQVGKSDFECKNSNLLRLSLALNTDLWFGKVTRGYYNLISSCCK